MAVVASFVKLLLRQSHHMDLLHVHIELVMEGRSSTNNNENVFYIRPTYICIRVDNYSYLYHKLIVVL